MNFDDKKQAYASAVAAADLELKGKNNLYTSHNGHMFSFLGKDGTLAVRLSKEGKELFNSQHGTDDVMQYNSVMNGYVHVIESIAEDEKQFVKLLKQGLDFVSTLTPK